MALLKPFAALRPRPEVAVRICELPYDVMSSAEARETARDNSLSFLHVSKPEIDLPPDTNPYSPEVYAKGRENFDRLQAEGMLCRDPFESFYFYRQVLGKHRQVGLVATASVEEYLGGTIRKHELTRIDKEDDRVRHLEALDAQTGPVFLAYRADSTINAFVEKRIAKEPDVDFVASDGVRHSAWVIADDEAIGWIRSAFAEIAFLYIADGHHRSAAAARVSQSRKGRGNSGWFLAVIFPHNQMNILAYNRVLKDLNGLSLATVLRKLEAVFVIQTPGASQPVQEHQLGLYLQGTWRTLHFRPQFAASSDPIEKLDVTLLQKHVLDPIFGIEDPRTSTRVNFVGGIRGTAELERMVDGGLYACAFSMFPTSIDDLMAIADRGGIMPPKSTWFEPKLRDGMFSHLLD